jgi:hypothetical protein
VQQISPSEDLIKQFFELDDFVPHLTLGKEQDGGNISRTEKYGKIGRTRINALSQI